MLDDPRTKSIQISTLNESLNAGSLDCCIPGKNMERFQPQRSHSGFLSRDTGN